MYKTIGVLAHVDAGKTTLSEQILYHARAIRVPGRVDHQDTLLDYRPTERRRGITIFGAQASFTLGGTGYYLVDTPGHVDFAAEMERSLCVLDVAVVVVSCVEGVQAHTETICQMLAERGIPTFFFLNKIDREGADAGRTLKQIQERCAPGALDFTDGYTQMLIEELAQLDDELLERYLDGGFDEALWQARAGELIAAGRVCPCCAGSALGGSGVAALLQGLEGLPSTHFDAEGPLQARAYQVRHDDKGNRLVFLKILRGRLQVKDAVGEEKIDELFFCQGERRIPSREAVAGQLCAVKGLSQIRPGDGIGLPALEERAFRPALAARVIYEHQRIHEVLRALKTLEDEEPLLAVTWQEALQEMRVNVMGPIQLEVLAEQLQSRFGLTVTFGPCEVLYLETVTAPAVGCGHFEPLRHYAEVHLRLEPGPRGSGITFKSACPVDQLEQNWQNLIRTHVLEKQHKGPLTGAGLTDTVVTLLAGRAHEKHTEGGDFREATYRAIRQGLFHAEVTLLEPVYAFRIAVPSPLAGRVMTDISRMQGRFDPPRDDGESALIAGEAPVANMMDYAADLAAFTKGRGRISQKLAGYRPCHNADEVIAHSGYERERDEANTADSVFCSHGAGYRVRWDEAPAHMHCKL